MRGGKRSAAGSKERKAKLEQATEELEKIELEKDRQEEGVRAREFDRAGSAQDEAWPTPMHRATTCKRARTRRTRLWWR